MHPSRRERKAGKSMVEQKEATRLLIAEDHALVREGLRLMLADEQGLEIVAEASDGGQAVEACRNLEPDLVLMDVRMPGMNGLTATKKIKREHPSTKVLMISTREQSDYLLEALRSGASGYLFKDSNRQEFVEAIHSVLADDAPEDLEHYIQTLQGVLREGSRAGHDTYGEELRASLTSRETDVLRLLVRGDTNPEIARSLLLSRSTVKLHVHQILAKLDVSDRTGAAVRAVELGLVPRSGARTQKNWSGGRCRNEASHRQ